MLATFRPNAYLDLSGFQPYWKLGELDAILSEHKRSSILRKLLFGTDWHGHLLMSWLSDYARANGCKQLHLDSGVQRFDAHRFYLREHMDITCHHFGLVLDR